MSPFETSSGRRRLLAMALIVAGTAVGAVAIDVLPLSFVVINALTIGLIYAAASTGWALAAGYGGLFSFGYSAVFGLPAYGSLLLFEQLDIPPLIGLAIASVVSAVLAAVVLLPTLRLRGPYFSLATLAIAVIVLTIFNNARDTTGGADGLLIPTDKEGLLYLNSIDERAYAVWAFVLCVLCVVVVRAFVHSSSGAQLEAVRDDEDVARSLGVRATLRKSQVLAISSVIGGLAGGVLAYSTHVVGTTGLLELVVGLNVLMYAAIGGLRSAVGPALGALLLVFVSQVLQNSVGVDDSPQLFPIIYALIFLAVLYLAPSGLVPVLGGALGRFGVGSATVSASDWGFARKRTAPDRTGGEHWTGGDPALVRELRRELESGRAAARRAPSNGHGPLLAVIDARKRFGAVVATNGVSLEIATGERVGIWGPNGSGKSTLLNLIGGQLDLDGGQIQLAGRRIDTLHPEERARCGLLRTFQQARVFEAQSTLENLRAGLVAATSLNLLRRADKAYADDLCRLALRATGVPERTWLDRAGTLSTGQRKRLELARVLVCPRLSLLLLDEPTAGLDRHGIPLLVELLDTIAAEVGVAMVVVDHDIPFVAAASERIIAMQAGEIRGQVDARQPDLDALLSGHVELEEVS